MTTISSPSDGGDGFGSPTPGPIDNGSVTTSAPDEGSATVTTMPSSTPPGTGSGTNDSSTGQALSITGLNPTGNVPSEQNQLTLTLQITSVGVESMDDNAKQLIKEEVAAMAYLDDTATDLVNIDSITEPDPNAQGTASARRSLITGNVTTASTNTRGTSESNGDAVNAATTATSVDVTVTIQLQPEQDENVLSEALENGFNNGTFLQQLKEREDRAHVTTFSNSKLRAYIIYGQQSIRVGGSSQDDATPLSAEEAMKAIFAGNLTTAGLSIPWVICWLGALATIVFVVGILVAVYRLRKRKYEHQQPLDDVHRRPLRQRVSRFMSRLFAGGPVAEEVEFNALGMASGAFIPGDVHQQNAQLNRDSDRQHMLPALPPGTMPGESDDE
eukprot:jgi/Tetstr1/428392/TSEL_001830.t1